MVEGGRELELRGTHELADNSVKGRLLPHMESLSVEAARPVKRWKKRDCGLVPVPSPPWCYHHWENPHKPLSCVPSPPGRACLFRTAGLCQNHSATWTEKQKNNSEFYLSPGLEENLERSFDSSGRRIFLSECWRCNNT